MIHEPAIQKHFVAFAASARHPQKQPRVQVITLGRPDTVFFAGFGNEAPALRHTVRLLRAKRISDVAVVCAMPYWEALDSMDSMIGLGAAGNVAVMRYLRQLTGRRRLHTIAESQAAAALVHAAVQEPELFKGRVALLRPLGLVQIRKRQFVGRMTRGASQREQLLDWRVVSVGHRAAWRTLQTLVRKGVRLTAALAWDISRHLGELHALKRQGLRVFIAERDLLYPPGAVRAALRTLKEPPEAEVIVGSHSSPATHAGVAQVTYVVQWCRTAKTSESVPALEESSN